MNNPTLSFYAREAAAYAARERFAPGRSRGADDYARRMDAFLTVLPPGGAILELGCGVAGYAFKMCAVRPASRTPQEANSESRSAVATLRYLPALRPLSSLPERPPFRHSKLSKAPPCWRQSLQAADGRRSSPP